MILQNKILPTCESPVTKDEVNRFYFYSFQSALLVIKDYLKKHNYKLQRGILSSLITINLFSQINVGRN